MTTTEILNAARRKILEDTDDIVTDVTLLLYANQAYIEVYKRTFTQNKVATTTVSCAAGVCTLPADYGRMYSRAIDESNRQYEEVSVADFYENLTDYNYTIDDGSIMLSQTDATSLTVRYYAKPETLSGSVNPTIDEYFHEVIVYGIVWRAHEDLQDEELSAFYQQKFESELARRIGNQSNYEENNQRGGQMFNYQRLI